MTIFETAAPAELLLHVVADLEVLVEELGEFLLVEAYQRSASRG